TPQAFVVRSLSDESFPQWDAFVEKHPLGLIYHTTAWKRCLEQAFPHMRARFLALVDPRSDDIVAGLPVYEVRSRLLGNRLVSVPFASICDPLVSSASQMQALLAPLLDLKTNMGARRIEVRALKNSRVLADAGWTGSAGHVHHVLYLDKLPDTVLPSFEKKSIRYEIKKASKSGFRVIVGQTAADLAVFFRIICLDRKRLGLPQIPNRFFSAMWDGLDPRQRTLYLAVRDGQAAAALLTTQFSGFCSVEYAGDTRIAGGSGINKLLYWQAIQAAKQLGYTAFGFGRTAIGNEGLRQFKKRWGTIEEPIFSFTYGPGKPGNNADPSITYHLARFAIRHLPRSLYRILGNFIYRHWG
ncbi:MAG: GNAT family N-acetyltransferase, partial [Candidatus Aminicenantes bacterium]|nr:GNAT family N-acetyltransferase [Candidatus Aminicenantes bacterium]